jgi:hypothetical protein
LKRWAVFIVVVFVITVIGNWVRKELSPNQYGPLADVTWKPSGIPNTVHVHLEDKQGQPLVATLLTVYTDDDEYDFTTNLQGEATIVCAGRVLFGIESQHRTVFSKSLALYTGSPALANGLDIKIIAKRPDLIAADQDYDAMKYLVETKDALREMDQKIKQEIKTDDASASDLEPTPLSENAVEESTAPKGDGEQSAPQ